MSIYTRRITIDAMEQLLQQPIKVLDKGEIRLIEYMGSDKTIVDAARVSYGQGTKTVRDDSALIHYLLRNHHTSPFEMCEILLYIKLPIFVAAQWIRHRTANINSYSARYSVLTDEFYIPTNLKEQSSINKQCSGNNISNPALISEIEEQCIQAYNMYTKMLEQGVSRELARMILPQNIYTYWYWKIDLHNLLHFLRLRTHSHAQYEIQVYAKAILDQIVAHWVPITYNAFCQHRLGSISLSKASQLALHDYLHDNLQSREHYQMGKGEWGEFLQLIDVNEM